MLSIELPEARICKLSLLLGSFSGIKQQSAAVAIMSDLFF
jgi:hypothetical protein